MKNSDNTIKLMSEYSKESVVLKVAPNEDLLRDPQHGGLGVDELGVLILSSGHLQFVYREYHESDSGDITLSNTLSRLGLISEDVRNGLDVYESLTNRNWYFPSHQKIKERYPDIGGDLNPLVKDNCILLTDDSEELNVFNITSEAMLFKAAQRFRNKSLVMKPKGIQDTYGYYKDSNGDVIPKPLIRYLDSSAENLLTLNASNILSIKRQIGIEDFIDKKKIELALNLLNHDIDETGKPFLSTDSISNFGVHYIDETSHEFDVNTNTFSISKNHNYATSIISHVSDDTILFDELNDDEFELDILNLSSGLLSIVNGNVTDFLDNEVKSLLPNTLYNVTKLKGGNSIKISKSDKHDVATNLEYGLVKLIDLDPLTGMINNLSASGMVFASKDFIQYFDNIKNGVVKLFDKILDYKAKLNLNKSSDKSGRFVYDTKSGWSIKSEDKIFPLDRNKHLPFLINNDKNTEGFLPKNYINNGDVDDQYSTVSFNNNTKYTHTVSDISVPFHQSRILYVYHLSSPQDIDLTIKDNGVDYYNFAILYRDDDDELSLYASFDNTFSGFRSYKIIIGGINTPYMNKFNYVICGNTINMISESGNEFIANSFTINHGNNKLDRLFELSIDVGINTLSTNKYFISNTYVSTHDDPFNKIKRLVLINLNNGVNGNNLIVKDNISLLKIDDSNKDEFLSLFENTSLNTGYVASLQTDGFKVHVSHHIHIKDSDNNTIGLYQLSDISNMLIPLEYIMGVDNNDVIPYHISDGMMIPRIESPDKAGMVRERVKYESFIVNNDQNNPLLRKFKLDERLTDNIIYSSVSSFPNQNGLFSIISSSKNISDHRFDEYDSFEIHKKLAIAFNQSDESYCFPIYINNVVFLIVFENRSNSHKAYSISPSTGDYYSTDVEIVEKDKLSHLIRDMIIGVEYVICAKTDKDKFTSDSPGDCSFSFIDSRGTLFYSEYISGVINNNIDVGGVKQEISINLKDGLYTISKSNLKHLKNNVPIRSKRMRSSSAPTLVNQGIVTSSSQHTFEVTTCFEWTFNLTFTFDNRNFTYDDTTGIAYFHPTTTRIDQPVGLHIYSGGMRWAGWGDGRGLGFSSVSLVSLTNVPHPFLDVGLDWNTPRLYHWSLQGWASAHWGNGNGRHSYMSYPGSNIYYNKALPYESKGYVIVLDHQWKRGKNFQDFVPLVVVNGHLKALVIKSKRVSVFLPGPFRTYLVKDHKPLDDRYWDGEYWNIPKEDFDKVFVKLDEDIYDTRHEVVGKTRILIDLYKRPVGSTHVGIKKASPQKIYYGPTKNAELFSLSTGHMERVTVWGEEYQLFYKLQNTANKREISGFSFKIRVERPQYAAIDTHNIDHDIKQKIINIKPHLPNYHWREIVSFQRIKEGDVISIKFSNDPEGKENIINVKTLTAHLTGDDKNVNTTDPKFGPFYLDYFLDFMDYIYDPNYASLNEECYLIIEIKTPIVRDNLIKIIKVEGFKKLNDDKSTSSVHYILKDFQTKYPNMSELTEEVEDVGRTTLSTNFEVPLNEIDASIAHTAIDSNYNDGYDYDVMTTLNDSKENRLSIIETDRIGEKMTDNTDRVSDLSKSFLKFDGTLNPTDDKLMKFLTIDNNINYDMLIKPIEYYSTHVFYKDSSGDVDIIILFNKTYTRFMIFEYDDTINTIGTDITAQFELVRWDKSNHNIVDLSHSTGLPIEISDKSIPFKILRKIGSTGIMNTIVINDEFLFTINDGQDFQQIHGDRKRSQEHNYNSFTADRIGTVEGFTVNEIDTLFSPHKADDIHRNVGKKKRSSSSNHGVVNHLSICTFDDVINVDEEIILFGDNFELPNGYYENIKVIFDHTEDTINYVFEDNIIFTSIISDNRRYDLLLFDPICNHKVIYNKIIHNNKNLFLRLKHIDGFNKTISESVIELSMDGFYDFMVPDVKTINNFLSNHIKLFVEYNCLYITVKKDNKLIKRRLNVDIVFNSRFDFNTSIYVPVIRTSSKELYTVTNINGELKKSECVGSTEKDKNYYVDMNQSILFIDNDPSDLFKYITKVQEDVSIDKLNVDTIFIFNNNQIIDKDSILTFIKPLSKFVGIKKIIIR